MGSVASGAVLGLSGCLSQGGPMTGLTNSSNDPKVKFEGNVSTGEPLVSGTELSTDAAYPHHYSAVVDAKPETDRIRWEYIRDEISPIEDELRETDFESELLTLFGMVLPQTKQLQPRTVSFDDGVLYVTFEVGERSSAASGLAINTSIQRVRTEESPDDVEFGVRF